MEVVLRRLGPVGISAVLCSLLVMAAVVGFAATRSESDGRPGTAADQSIVSLQPGTGASSGDRLVCPNGGSAETAYSQIGSEFRIVGRIASIEGTQLLVKGPERYVKVMVPASMTTGALASGDIIKASGAYDANGDAQATDIQHACDAPSAVSILTPAPTTMPESTSLPNSTETQPTITPVSITAVSQAAVTEDSVPTPRKTRSPNSAEPASGSESAPSKHKPKH